MSGGKLENQTSAQVGEAEIQKYLQNGGPRHEPIFRPMKGGSVAVDYEMTALEKEVQRRAYEDEKWDNFVEKSWQDVKYFDELSDVYKAGQILYGLYCGALENGWLEFFGYAPWNHGKHKDFIAGVLSEYLGDEMADMFLKMQKFDMYEKVDWNFSDDEKRERSEADKYLAEKAPVIERACERFVVRNAEHYQDLKILKFEKDKEYKKSERKRKWMLFVEKIDHISPAYVGLCIGMIGLWILLIVLYIKLI